MATKSKNRVKQFDNDRWLTKNFERIVDKYAGRYILAVNGKILYTDKDGTPREIAAKAKAKFPDAIPFFMRVPRPKDFICALNAA